MGAPADEGFYMPAEWTSHAGCWIASPGQPVSCDEMEETGKAFAEGGRAIARCEPLTRVARSQDGDDARRHSGETVRVLELPIDDSWPRDTGPSMLNAASQHFVVSDSSFESLAQFRFGLPEPNPLG